MEYNVNSFTNRDELDDKIKAEGNSESDIIVGTAEDLKRFNLSPKRTVCGVRVVQI